MPGEARRQADELVERPAGTAPAPPELAALIMGELADSTGTGRIAQTLLEHGTRPATLAETARLLLAACPGAGLAGSPSPGSIPPGVLAFVAVAAHANGDEEEQARCTQALLDLARRASDKGLLRLADDVFTWTGPDEAPRMLVPYLHRHPHDIKALEIWAQASLRADPVDPSDHGWTPLLLEDGRRVWEARFGGRPPLMLRADAERPGGPAADE